MLGLRGTQLFCCVAWLSIFIAPALVLAVGPEDAEGWRNPPCYGSIAVAITSPANNTYLPVNHSMWLTATASDNDQYRVGETWYDYSDEVNSGDTSTNHHIWWTASGGQFTDNYGAIAGWLAPGYSTGNDVRNVTVTAHADDFNRGTDTYGYNDGAKTASMNVKVWQVTLTVTQGGTASANYDGSPIPTACGGTTLGWIIPGTPAGAEGYYGNTQIKGSIPLGPGATTGYQWYQHMKGFVRYKQNGSWQYLENYADWVIDFQPGYPGLDADSRHPNITGNDVREIFAMDPPGFNAGASNDAGIAGGTTDFNADMDYKPKVNLDNIIISNEPEWEVKFTLDVQNGKWHVVGSHTP